jgi:hypothetical protein
MSWATEPSLQGVLVSWATELSLQGSYSYTPKYADTPISGDAPISGDTTHMGSKEIMAQMDSLAKGASNLHGSVCVVKPWLLLEDKGWFAVALELIAALDTTTGETVLLSSDTPYGFHISLLPYWEYQHVADELVAIPRAYIRLLSTSGASDKLFEGEYAMGGLLSWTTEEYKSTGHSECLDITLLGSHANDQSVELQRRLLDFLHHIRHLLGLPLRLDTTFHVSIRRFSSDDTNRSDGEEEEVPGDEVPESNQKATRNTGTKIEIYSEMKRNRYSFKQNGNSLYIMHTSRCWACELRFQGARVWGHRAKSTRGPRVLGSSCLGPSSRVYKGSSCLGPTSQVSNGFSYLGPSSPVSEGSYCFRTSSQVSRGPCVLGHRAKQPKATKTVTKSNQTQPEIKQKATRKHPESNPKATSWLAGWLAGWLGWLAGWLAVRLAGWLAGWLAFHKISHNIYVYIIRYHDVV